MSVNVQRGDAKSCCSCLCLGADHDWGVILHGEGKKCCIGGASNGIEVFGGDVEREIDERLTVGFEECREPGLA